MANVIISYGELHETWEAFSKFVKEKIPPGAVRAQLRLALKSVAPKYREITREVNEVLSLYCDHAGNGQFTRSKDQEKSQRFDQEMRRINAIEVEISDVPIRLADIDALGIPLAVEDIVTLEAWLIRGD